MSLPKLKVVTYLMMRGTNVIKFSALVTLLFLGAIWALTVTLIVHDRDAAIAQAAKQSASLSLIVASDLNDVIERAVAYGKHGAFVLAQKDVASTTRIATPDPVLLSIAVFDLQSQVIHASPSASADFELVKLARQLIEERQVESGSSAAVVGKQNETTDPNSHGMRIALPLHLAQHRSVVILAANIDLTRLLARYAELGRTSGTTIKVLHSDGSLLSGGRREALSFLGAGTSHAALTEAAEPLNVNANRFDANQVGAFRQLDQIPVCIFVSRSKEAIIGELSGRHRILVIRAAVVSCTFVMMIVLLLGLVRRYQRLNRHLARSEAAKSELIEQLESEKLRAFELASYDFVTGLPNRMMFHRLASAELGRARRSRRVYALYFLDLDKFKTINDTLGHAAGDLLLKAVAERLRASLREYDLVARLGGDEFVALVSELESTERVGKIAAKLVESLSVPYPGIGNEPIEVTPSIGIALYPGDGQDINRLLSNADVAMYDAKRSGRGTYRFFDGSLNTSSARKLELISRFRRAIRTGEFCLHYQMRIGLQNMQAVGMEALVRWQHPMHGLIYPGEFIDLAEEHDFIVPLGHWAIDEACAQLAEWRTLGMPLLPVAINISAKQLRDEKLVDVVLDALARHAIPATLLEIEVTESCFLERPEIAKQVLEKLDATGIKISLDDYGTGFSGLSHLKQLPISAVKIDRSFIRDIRNDTSDAMIVSSTITLSHSLGLKVVAEGVETKEQLVHLKAAGCDEVQGFFCHRPTDADEIATALGTSMIQAA